MEDSDSEESEGEEVVVKSRKVPWTLHSVKNIGWTQRQLISVTI